MNGSICKRNVVVAPKGESIVENHDMALGKLLTSGVDLWLNTPLSHRSKHRAPAG